MAGQTNRESVQSVSCFRLIFGGCFLFCSVLPLLLPGPFCLNSDSQTAVRGMLHRDPSGALRKSLEDPPIFCKDEAVKVRKIPESMFRIEARTEW